MRTINFYDPALRHRRDWTGTVAALALLAVTTIVVAAAGAWIRHDAKGLQATAASAAAISRTKTDALATLEARYARVKADAALENRLRTLQATLAHRQADLKLLGGGALQDNSGYSNAMQALARQSVEGLWLTGVAMDHGSMTLRGRTFRPELIAVYVGRLNGEPALQGQAFRELDIRRPVDDSVAAAPAVPAAPADTPPALQPVSGTARRLAPYVEFSLIGSRLDSTDGVAASATAAPTERKP